MKKTELLQKIADNLSQSTMENIYPNIAFSCKYYSDGRMIAKNKNEVCNFFTKRNNATKRDNVSNYAYYARIDKSANSAISVGDSCVALAQYDKYNCVGFMMIKVNIFGKIKEINFHTDSNVVFKADEPGRFNISSVPKDAHDSISYRAFAFGIMDENVVLSRHIQRYDVFQEYVQQIYAYIYHNLTTDFNTGITNAAGYLYVAAMCEALKRATGKTIFTFDEKKATIDATPKVDDYYQTWINAGYEKGKKLFFGFIEYVNLRHPNDKAFNESLLQSYMDMCLYGSTQANKDIDMGKVN